jgi:hypothetical protein
MVVSKSKIKMKLKRNQEMGKTIFGEILKTREVLDPFVDVFTNKLLELKNDGISLNSGISFGHLA